MMGQKELCSVCNGKGNTLKDNDKCGDCNGAKIINEKKVIKVDVEKGAPDGCRYNFYGEGNEKEGMEIGDVHVEIFLENKTKFERKGADLATSVDITIIEALTKFEIPLKHLDGRTIYIRKKKDEIIQPGTIKTINECGLPFHQAPYRHGNLYISFNVVIPTLDKEVQEKLSEVSFIIITLSFLLIVLIGV